MASRQWQVKMIGVVDFHGQQVRRIIKLYQAMVFRVSVRVQQGGGRNGEWGHRQQASVPLMQCEEPTGIGGCIC